MKLRWASSIIVDQRLTLATRLFGCYCERFINVRGQFWISKGTASRALGVTEKSIQRGVGQLKAFGYLRVVPRTGRTNLCEMVIHSEDAEDGLERCSNVPPVGHHCPAGRDTSVPQISYKSKLESFRTSKTSNPGPRPFQQKGLEGRNTRGPEYNLQMRSEGARLEIQLAKLLGPDGFLILEDLPKPKLAYLLRKVGDGMLSDSELAAIRLHFIRRHRGGGGP
jgi:hypothetical protein